MRQDFNYPARVWRPRTTFVIVFLAVSIFAACLVLVGLYAKLGGGKGGEFSFIPDGLNVLLPLLGMGAFSYFSLLQFALFPDIEIRPDGFRLRAGIFRSQRIPWDKVTKVTDVPIFGKIYPHFGVAGKGFGFPFSQPLLPFLLGGRGFLVNKDIGDIETLRAIFADHMP